MRDIIEKIGKEGREGVVIKDVEMTRPPIKYTTSQTNCSDLSYAFRYFGEYGRDFMLSRLIREGFQSFEFCENEGEVFERCMRIGMSILKPMIESIREVAEGKKVYEKSRLRFYDLDVFDLFKQHVKRMGIDAKFSEPLKTESGYVVWFYKYMKSTTDKIKHVLKGNTWS